MNLPSLDTLATKKATSIALMKNKKSATKSKTTTMRETEN